MELRSESFPLVFVDIPSDYISDISETIEIFEEIFNLAKKNKTRTSIIIDCSLAEGIGPFVVIQLVKYLHGNKHHIEKYFNKTALLMENKEGFICTILGLYNPVRPLELFNVTDKQDAITWSCSVE